MKTRSENNLEQASLKNDGVLQIRNLDFAWPNRRLFSHFNLSLGRGITWIRGRNGSGKTTLLNILAGALEAENAEILFGELNQTREPLAWRLQTYWCSSETPSFHWLSLQEFFDLHLNLYPQADATNLQQQIQAFGLGHMLGQKISALSLGQHKKMGLCLALTLPVQLLLIDEPFNALDLEAINYLRSQLQHRAQLAQQCILITSHADPELVLMKEFSINV